MATIAEVLRHLKRDPSDPDCGYITADDINQAFVDLYALLEADINAAATGSQGPPGPAGADGRYYTNARFDANGHLLMDLVDPSTGLTTVVDLGPIAGTSGTDYDMTIRVGDNTIGSAGHIYYATWPVGTPAPAWAVGTGTIANPAGWTDAGPVPPSQHIPAQITTVTAPSQNPQSNPPLNPNPGDTFVNLFDNTSWVFDGQNWVPLAVPSSATNPPTVTTSTAPGQTPTSNPPQNPQSGDVFLNLPDQTYYIYDGNSWQPVANHPAVTSVATPGQTPTAVSPPNPGPGDVFTNTADHTTFVFDGTNWVQTGFSTPPACCNNVTALPVAGSTPANPGATPVPTPIAGDIIINPADQRTWIYDGAQWVPVPIPTAGTSVATVTSNANPGQTPTTNPPAGSQPGDVFINTVDGATWIFDGTQWVPATGGAARPVVTSTPTTGQTPTSNPPGNPHSGDTFTNTADHTTWIYDGTTWQPVGCPDCGDVPTVTQATAPGIVPDATTAPNPRSGDTFINDADQVTWVYDGTNWVALPASAATPAPSVTTATTPGQTPTSTPPALPAVGDVFINPADQTTWIYDGTQWVPVGCADCGPPAVTTTTNLGSTPGTNPPPNSRAGDTFINTADKIVWLYDGSAWVPLPDQLGSGSGGGTGTQRPPIVTVTATSGQNPSTATLPNAQSGDTYINSADKISWMFNGTAWVPLPDQTGSAPTTWIHVGDGTNGAPAHLYTVISMVKPPLPGMPDPSTGVVQLNSWTDWGSFAGPPGLDGTGVNVVSGAGAPTQGTGGGGAGIYFDTATASLWTKQANGLPWTGPTPLAAADGQDGAPGNTIMNGDTPPLVTDGVDGDYYIDNVNNILYGPKANGAWPAQGVPLVQQPLTLTAAPQPNGDWNLDLTAGPPDYILEITSPNMDVTLDLQDNDGTFPIDVTVDGDWTQGHTVHVMPPVNVFVQDPDPAALATEGDLWVKPVDPTGTVVYASGTWGP